MTCNYLEHISCHIYYSIDIPYLCIVVNLNRLKQEIASDKTENTFTGLKLEEVRAMIIIKRKADDNIIYLSLIIRFNWNETKTTYTDAMMA